MALRLARLWHGTPWKSTRSQHKLVKERAVLVLSLELLLFDSSQLIPVACC